MFLSALLLFPAAVAAWFIGGAPTVVGVAVGGATALSNFWLLSRLVVKSTAGAEGSAGGLWAQLMFKFGLLGLLLAVSIFAFGIDGLGLLLGLSIMFAAVPLNLVSEMVAEQRSRTSGGSR